MGIVLALNVGASIRLDRGIVELASADRYHAPAFAGAAQRAIDVIPDRASLATQDNIVDRLAHRPIATLIGPTVGSTDYVLADVLHREPRTSVTRFATLSRFVDARLTTHVPVFFEDGWLVLRERSLGPAPDPPAVAPPSGAARLRATGSAWGTTAATYEQALAACAARAAGPGCYRPLGAAFRDRHTALASFLATAPLGDDCGPLAEPVGPVTALVAGALADERQAGIDGDAKAGTLAAARLKQLRDEDATGFLVRLVALCAG